MHSIATFFAEIVAFFSLLFGYHAPPVAIPPAQPLIVVEAKATINTISSPTISKKVEVLASSTILYTNEKYGFTLLFPETWKKYRMYEGPRERCLCDSNLRFGINKIDDAFVIEVYTVKEWKALNNNPRYIKSELPLFMGENQKYIFVGWIGHDNNDDPVTELSGSILTSFKFRNK